MSLESLQDLYLDQIRDLYSAEQQIIDALPNMVERATNPKLSAGFTRHLEQTRQQVGRLERIGQRMEQRVTGKKCKGMEGLLKEGDEAVDEHGNPHMIDAALIAAAQRVEHYEIAAYGCARTYAEALGLNDDVAVLQQTLDEEAETDEYLTRISISILNPDEQAGIAVEQDADRPTPLRPRKGSRDSDARA
jgi:ferritin-like metal-binding protein YciE